MKVTIKDIARALGCAPSTVSRALNDSPLISETTRKKVKERAREMGFYFNENARALVGSRTNRITLFVSRYFTQFESEHFFRRMNKVLIGELEKYGIEVVMTPSHNSHTGESNIYKGVSGRRPDGIIIAHSDLTGEEYDYLRETGIPLLFIYYDYPFLTEKDNFVGSDNFRGGYLAAEDLIKKGAKNLISLTCRGESKEFQERNRGYLAAIEELGGRNLGIYRRNFNYEDTYSFTEEEGDILAGCEGIFLQTDHYFFGIERGLRELGLELGRDIDVIGYDNMDLIKYFSYKEYRSVDQNLDALVRRGIDHLMRVIRGETSESIREVLEPEILRG